jgi:anti-anti-sigma factor
VSSSSLSIEGGLGASAPLGGFGLTVTFAGARVVLGVRGDIDLVSAPEFEAVLEAVIDQGHISVVLDLAELGSMDAAGLGVIASGACRLIGSGGELTLRSAPALVTRTLDITGLTGLVRFEQPEPVDDRLGPEQPDGVPGVPVQADVAGLDQDLKRIMAIPADDDVVDGALRLVAVLARATVGGADGVSVSLRRHGRLATVASSDQTLLDMDAEQYATGEGPCVDASVQGRWFHVESLDQETRWPAFIPRARQLGINAILSTPLLAEARPVGALNIYSRTRAAFSAKEQELASTFATEASVILRGTGVDISADQLSGRIGEALRARQVIAQAQGVLMEREGISEEDAYTRLRVSSQRTDGPLLEQAVDVVGSTRRPRPDLPDQIAK